MNLPRQLFALLVLCSIGPLLAGSDSVVVFNEIHYHPAQADESEWIELHNQMSVDIDLSRWTLTGGIEFGFPEGTIIPGQGYLLVAANPDQVADALGPFEGKLDNNGERLRLLSASGRLMNEVRYKDRGEWPIAPDGTGVTLAKGLPDATPGDVSAWTWSRELGGTPGEQNFPDIPLPSAFVIINELASLNEAEFWVELHNRSTTDEALEGLELLHVTSGTRVPLGKPTLSPGEFLSVSGFPQEIASGDPIALIGNDTVLDAIRVKERGRGRFPDGSVDWRFVSEPTTGGPNKSEVHTDIVFNEIFYHHQPQYADGDVPYAIVDDEWIELYHRGEVATDLSGWQLDGDIEHGFPEGTLLEPGGFLVVRNDASGFSGNLPNGSGHLILEDAAGNVADEVRYHDGGDWPTKADGGGSSLELRDPMADNAHAIAWAPSDELARTSWQEISYRGEAERSRVGPDNQWSELVIGLLGRGEILIDDIQVVEDPDGQGAFLVNNSAFQPSLFGGTSLRRWRLRGNHRHSEVVPDPDDPNNQVLRLVATGPAGHMHNHIETTLAGGVRISNGTTYEFRFRARALSGTPQLHTRLYFNRLAKKHILTTLAGGGTPGQPNSQLVSNLGPTLDDLTHHPAVPRPNETTRIEIAAADPDGIGNVTLHWSTDGADFQESAMNLEGDRYSASVPAQQADAIIQFYVEATDSEGAVSQYPREGADSRALFSVLDDDQLGNDRLHHLRIIMHPDDVDWLHESINLMSNDRVPATVIYREKEIFYNVGVRLKGSERGRVTVPRLGYNVKFPKQQQFRGVHETVAIDRSEGVGFGQFEILFNQMMTHSGGIPAEHNDLVQVIAPRSQYTGPAELQLARYGDLFLETQFEDGDEGNLYEYELIYYPTTDDADGYKRPNPDSVVGTPVRSLGDDSESYRWNYELKNNRRRDDYAPIVAYTKLFSLSNHAFLEALPELVDVDRWLQGMGLALLSGAGDQYGANSQHNGMFYQMPNGKFTYFPHDLDFAHNASRSITENTDLRKILRNPAYERIYLAHVNDILLTTFNERYMTRWAEHFGELLPGQNFASHLRYIISRANSVQSQVRRDAPSTAFSLQTPSDQRVDTTTIELEGTGKLDLHHFLHVETGEIYRPTWTSLDSWNLSFPLTPGENIITLQGRNVLGSEGGLFNPIGRASINVFSTVPSILPFEKLDLQLENGQATLSYNRLQSQEIDALLETSEDLLEWLLLTPAETTTTAIDDTHERVLLTFPLSETETRFVRLRQP